MNTTRRNFVKKSGLMLSFVVGTNTLVLSPAQAYAEKLPFQILSESEAKVLEILADAIVPGARAAGISHFIDNQLSSGTENSLLMIRYLGVPAPYDGFYRSALNSAEQQTRERFKKSMDKLNAEELTTLVNDMAQGKIEDWQGPPANFFFFVLRSDAADVVYGTQAGFDHLDIPYMPHILPERPW